MKLKLILLLLSLAGSTFLKAQDIVEDLQTKRPNQGSVTLYQDPRIALLLKNSMVTNDTGERIIKHNGYRIQIFAGNNSRRAKNKAMHYAHLVRENFPEIKSYMHFLSPRWICRVGDFLSIEEADAVMRKMKKTGIFKEVSIVRDEVNISY